VAVFGARQVSRQRGALGLLLVGVVLRSRLALLDLLRQRGQVGVDGLFDQAFLFGVEGFALGGKLQALEHRHLVRELVDRRLLERDVVLAALDDLALGLHFAQQRAHCLAQLLRAERFELCVVDHET
jgi:hypothetical protein